jgi:hypothetical protein
MGSLGLSQLPEDSTLIMVSLTNQFGARDFYPSVGGVEQDLLPSLRSVRFKTIAILNVFTILELDCFVVRLHG